ncbi:MAG: 50S ribosomal protein L9 [Gammaproteobacteria bacterium RIFCSPHIGHO2_02_FULL_42_13]|nr:MAG: 50S ribosomal protein L9 [Gammaproteobacteria bacterium RIFCSPHIGHO2_02_FULL_42_13]OGT68056.1 MAG: 50S ribosomal protein L9 [Gammaproteobacteria bacterium RIFCSPLOWO2_02_FULL_42_9]
MEVILLEAVHNLGKLGDTVKVKPGYARNHLIPYGKAVPANEENIKKFEARRAELEKIAAEHLAVAQKRAEPFKNLEITLMCKTQDEGKLFGSIGVREIVDAITAKGLTVEKSEVTLPDGPIRSTGEYNIVLIFHSDVKAKIKLNVKSEETADDVTTDEMEKNGE